MLFSKLPSQSYTHTNFTLILCTVLEKKLALDFSLLRLLNVAKTLNNLVCFLSYMTEELEHFGSLPII